MAFGSRGSASAVRGSEMVGTRWVRHVLAAFGDGVSMIWDTVGCGGRAAVVYFRPSSINLAHLHSEVANSCLCRFEANLRETFSPLKYLP